MHNPAPLLSQKLSDSICAESSSTTDHPRGIKMDSRLLIVSQAPGGLWKLQLWINRLFIEHSQISQGDWEVCDFGIYIYICKSHRLPLASIGVMSSLHWNYKSLLTIHAFLCASADWWLQSNRCKTDFEKHARYNLKLQPPRAFWMLVSATE